MAISLLVGAKQGVGEFRLSESFSPTLAYIFKTLLGSVVNAITSVGAGLVGGIATFFMGMSSVLGGLGFQMHGYSYLALQYELGTWFLLYLRRRGFGD